MDAYNTPARGTDRTRRGADYELRMASGLPASLGRYPGTDPVDYLGDDEEEDS
jgi:hypothetical protein